MQARAITKAQPIWAAARILAILAMSTAPALAQHGGHGGGGMHMGGGMPMGGFGGGGMHMGGGMPMGGFGGGGMHMGGGMPMGGFGGGGVLMGGGMGYHSVGMPYHPGVGGFAGGAGFQGSATTVHNGAIGYPGVGVNHVGRVFPGDVGFQGGATFLPGGAMAHPGAGSDGGASGFPGDISFHGSATTAHSGAIGYPGAGMMAPAGGIGLARPTYQRTGTMPAGLIPQMAAANGGRTPASGGNAAARAVHGIGASTGQPRTSPAHLMAAHGTGAGNARATGTGTAHARRPAVAGAATSTAGRLDGPAAPTFSGWGNGNAAAGTTRRDAHDRGYGFAGWESDRDELRNIFRNLESRYKHGYGFALGLGNVFRHDKGFGYASLFSAGGYGLGFVATPLVGGFFNGMAPYVWIFIPGLGWVYVPVNLALLMGFL